jgi:DNA-binding Lrp family transcriptional regulator
MSVKAYIMINTMQSQVGSALSKLRQSHSVLSAEAVTGPYDIMLTVEAEDMDTLGQLIVNELQPAPGVERTITCVVFKL